MLYATDDGSFGHKGFVTDLLSGLLEQGESIDLVVAIGPIPMMRAVAELTRPKGIPTTVSLNPVMVDGTGMCGGCRVTVDGQVKFACVDGPEFDGHKVDFEELMARNRQYTEEEQFSLGHHHEGRCALMSKIPPRTKMPVQPAAERIKNFSEVNLGFSPEEAWPAKRCIQCKHRPCVTVSGSDRYSRFRSPDCRERFAEALAKIKEKNSLPAICGRVCPQERQCEAMCTLGKRFEPVAIGALERFVADWGRAQGVGEAVPMEKPAQSLGKVATVGSGPASITCAAELARLGYEVTIFEALHEPGGVLVYGIPEFRLPKAIVKEEIDYVRSLGVEIRTNVIIGQTLTLQELFTHEGFDASSWVRCRYTLFPRDSWRECQRSLFLQRILTRVNLMKAYKFPRWIRR